MRFFLVEVSSLQLKKWVGKTSSKRDFPNKMSKLDET